LNYGFLPDGYRDTLIFVESLEEVMADKIILLPAIRHLNTLIELGCLKRTGAGGRSTRYLIISDHVI